MERQDDHATDSKRESSHSCAEADQVTLEHLKQENKRLKADNEKLRRENEQLHARVPKSTMPTERWMATCKVDDCCLRKEFATKTGELAASFKGAFQLFYRHLRSKLNKKIEKSVKKLEEDVNTCLEKLKEIDDNLAKHRQKEANPDADANSDSPVESEDQIELKKAKEECGKIIEELTTSFEKYNKLFSAEDMRPVSQAPTITGTDVGRVECKDFLLKIDEMCRELAECRMFFEKLHAAVTFTLEQKEKFRLIHKVIEVHEMHMQRSDVGDDFDDIKDTIDCFHAVSKEFFEGSNNWQKSMATMEDTAHFPQQIKDGGRQCAYIPGRDEKPPQLQATCRSGAEGKEDVENPSGQEIQSTPDVALKRDERASLGSTSEYNEPQEETTPHPKCDPKTVEEYFEFIKEEFLQVVAAKAIALKLTDKNVFPKKKETTMEKLDDEGKANSMLFEHFQKHADYDMAVVLSQVMIEEPAYPKMNKLGKEMLDYLEAHPGIK